jgi:hypothetical protein
MAQNWVDTHPLRRVFRIVVAVLTAISLQMLFESGSEIFV